MQINRISAELSEQDQKDIIAAIAEIKEKMPFLISLTGEEIRDLVKMGDKGRSFTAKAVEIVAHNPDIMPRGFDIDEFRRDMELFQSLEPIRAQLTQLLQLVESTQTLVGSDAYMGALVVYQQVKHNPLGVALDDAADHLSRRFVRKAKSKAPEPAQS